MSLGTVGARLLGNQLEQVKAKIEQNIMYKYIYIYTYDI